jgi:NAD(P)H dehydrogenase (quinone)
MQQLLFMEEEVKSRLLLLYSMMFTMFYHGRMIVILGVPYSVPELTQSGSPYGHSRIGVPMADSPKEEIDSKVALALGKRVLEIANGLTV